MKYSSSQIDVRNSNIDSLRAFAFFLVFFYHTGYLEAGYIGVDLFFILSGYLMTVSITRISMAKGMKGILTFAEKRISRLLPSILVMTCVTTFVSFLIVPDADRPEIMRTALTTLVAATNYYLALSQDYFGIAAIFNPFTHMWSISAEIHFYIVLSILGFGFGFKKYIFWGLVASLLCVNLLLYSDFSQSYLVSHFRIFSFLAGFILYTFVTTPPVQLKKSVGIKAVLIGLILISSLAKTPVIFSDIDWLFNSLVANILGFLLLYIILTSEGTKPDEAISNKNKLARAWVYLGRISYSLYLFHFPVVSYAFWIWGELTAIGLLGVFFCSLFLSALNYSLVEIRFAQWSGKGQLAGYKKADSIPN